VKRSLTISDFTLVKLRVERPESRAVNSNIFATRPPERSRNCFRLNGYCTLTKMATREKHPPDSTLLAYCDGSVSEEVLSNLKDHLNRCEDCTQRIVRIVTERLDL
jgi:hypothetical protein